MTRKQIREVHQEPAAMEPLFPKAKAGELREMAADLLRKSAGLGASLHPATRGAVVNLLRPMNSYYSNLIEGHNTHPLDIERALQNDYSADPAQRALQLESRAHVEVQILVEERLRNEPELPVCSPDFLSWIHAEFYSRLPDEFRDVKTASGGTDRVVPGEFRRCEVEVGRHIPPGFRSLKQFLVRFAEGYRRDRFDPIEWIIAAAASHHRLAWIHPFLDGNGRVTRLFTHAFFIQAKSDGHLLWTISRGLARRRNDYLAALAQADAPRRSDLDGRGNLSDEGLARFCVFFLSTAIDQVEFMTKLLDLDAMQERIAFATERWVARARAPETIARLLRDVFLRGEVTRGEAARILAKPERTARRVMRMLLDNGLLTSDAPGAPVRLGMPARLVGYYFPKLYPEGVEFDGG